jgi:hypothetical protein
MNTHRVIARSPRSVRVDPAAQPSIFRLGLITRRSTDPWLAAKPLGGARACRQEKGGKTTACNRTFRPVSAMAGSTGNARQLHAMWRTWPSFPHRDLAALGVPVAAAAAVPAPNEADAEPAAAPGRAREFACQQCHKRFNRKGKLVRRL